jgi:16S rRNA (uracil1498-N3)-methyltransferase
MKASLSASHHALPPPPRFFVAERLPRDDTLPKTCELDEDAATHIRVLRLQEGEAITLFDGTGGEFSARIEAIGKRSVTVSLAAFIDVERESPIAVTLVQALATGDKMDWVIQKATELGVAAIQPLSTERSTLKLTADRACKRHTHWLAIAVAACEQCGRNRVPTIHAVQTFDVWLASARVTPCVLLHPRADRSMTQIIGTATAASIVVGPEGGFSEDEMARATRAGVISARFGPRTLRTETAGLAALAVMQSAAGDLG